MENDAQGEKSSVRCIHKMIAWVSGLSLPGRGKSWNVSSLITNCYSLKTSFTLACCTWPCEMKVLPKYQERPWDGKKMHLDYVQHKRHCSSTKWVWTHTRTVHCNWNWMLGMLASPDDFLPYSFRKYVYWATAHAKHMAVLLKIKGEHNKYYPLCLEEPSLDSDVKNQQLHDSMSDMR